MKYYSTRNENPSANELKSSAEVIIEGIAPDGGLYIPESIPQIDSEFIEKLKSMSYPDRAAEVLSLFLTDFTKTELRNACNAAYSSDKFGSSPAPVVNAGDNRFLELWHGPTKAFKDMALQLMPRLLSMSLEKTGEKNDALILVATSGDTGKAALEGYSDVPRTSIAVFYPIDGVSEMQKMQMATQKGDNVYVCSIKGNFDDAQSGVKKIFADSAIVSALADKGLFLSSANSINWGRLAPQIVYFFSAYCDMLNSGDLKLGEKLDVTVPTGNFGNILAAYIAGRMGLPIGTLVCATNKNKVLADYFTTGKYDRRRKFFTTISPSMDILISSNLERLLSVEYGAAFCSGNMKSLSENGFFENNIKENSNIFKNFAGISCTEDETKATIANYFEKYGYLIDPHTAVAAFCADEYKKSGSKNKMLVVSTASPYKFPRAVADSLGLEKASDDFECLENIYEKTLVKIPEAISGLKAENIRFRDVVPPEKMADKVLSFADER